MSSAPTLVTQSSGKTSGETTSLTLNLPTGFTTGDLIVFIVANTDSGNGSAAPTGWTRLATPDTATATGVFVWYKILVGGEASTLTHSWADVRSAAYNGYRITGHDTTTPIAQGTVVTGVDSPSFSPSWGEKNTLWIPFVVGQAAAGKTGVTGNPSGYSNALNVVDAHNPGNVNGIYLGSASKTSLSPTENPATFTVDEIGVDHLANILAINSLATSNTLPMAVGAFTLTGVALGIFFNRLFTLATGAYTLAGQTLTFVLTMRWNNQSKNSSSFSNGTKHSATWTNGTKNSSSFTNLTKD